MVLTFSCYGNKQYLFTTCYHEMCTGKVFVQTRNSSHAKSTSSQARICIIMCIIYNEIGGSHIHNKIIITMVTILERNTHLHHVYCMSVQLV